MRGPSASTARSKNLGFGVLALISLLGTVRLEPGEHTRLRQVRGEHGRARQDLLDERPLSIGIEQARARLGDHHRVDHHGRALWQLVDGTRHRQRDIGRTEHPHLDRVNADVLERQHAPARERHQAAPSGSP